jgi:predicted metal-dependent phosphotriesterase family hydrolase
MKIIATFILLYCIKDIALAQTISASPGWTASVPATRITEAGRNYTTNVTSARTQTRINLLTATGIFTYTVSVHKVDTDWNNTLTLWVRRTGNGTGTGGTITGGTAYQQITNTTRSFFRGTVGTSRQRTNITVQYEIRNLSVTIPVKTLTTTLVYTLSD